MGRRQKQVLSETSCQYRKQTLHQSGCGGCVVSTLALFSGYFCLQMSALKLALFTLFLRGYPQFVQENAGILPLSSISYQFVIHHPIIRSHVTLAT
jgi:hypothetical protein